MAQKDFYQILGVAKTADDDVIKKAYRKLASQFHPDKNPGNKAAEEKFKEISEAFSVLSDKEKRRSYDQFGVAGAYAGAASGQGPFGGGFQGNPYARGPGGFQGHRGFEQQGGNDGFQDAFGDLFGDLFGGRAQQGSDDFRRSPRARRGADLRYNLNIDLEDVVGGTEKVISFIRQKNGKDETAKLSIKVPAGVQSGQKLKLRGEGDTVAQGEAGDLYVILSINSHALFERAESDLTMDLPISFVDAILGTTIDIPTLSGKVALKIPPGSSSGQVFRLKGKGFPSAKGLVHGDQLVRLMIDIPKEVSPKETELLRELQKTADNGTQIQKFREKLKGLSRT